MGNTTYIEKVLHELIRDLPDVRNANALFERGLINTEWAFRFIADAIARENNNKG